MKKETRDLEDTQSQYLPDSIREINRELITRLQKVPEGATPFQLRNFVVGSEATEFGRLQQCLLELRQRISSLERSYLKLERARVDLEEIEYKLANFPPGEEPPFARKRLLLDRSEKEIEIREILRSIRTLESEARSLFEIMMEFPLSVLETPEAQHWEDYLWRKVGINLALGQPLSQNLVESVLNMPDGSRIRSWMEEKIYGDPEESKTS